jgi:hypothetical protein
MAAVPGTADLASLQANRDYHYRIVATNAAGTATGADMTFATRRVAVKAFTAHVSPKHATRLPYRFTITGKVLPPSSIKSPAACRGTVIAQAKKGGKTIATRRTSLLRGCSYRLKLSFANAKKLGKHGQIKITVRFRGNDLLQAKTLRPITASYG